MLINIAGMNNGKKLDIYDFLFDTYIRLTAKLTFI